MYVCPFITGPVLDCPGTDVSDAAAVQLPKRCYVMNWAPRKRPGGFDFNHSSESLCAAESYRRFHLRRFSHLLFKIKPNCFPTEKRL